MEIKQNKSDKKVEEVLFGSLLGDGCIYLSNKKYRYTEQHSKKQKEYLMWKNKVLKFNFYHNNKRDNYMISKGNKNFKVIYDLFYQNETKVVSKEILKKINLLGLAVWFMDDGGYSYRTKSIYLYSQSFGLKGNEIIKDWFKIKFGISCKIRKSKKSISYIKGRKIIGLEGHFIQFNVENTKKLIILISIHVPKCMEYKIGKDRARIKNAVNKMHKYTSDKWKKIKKENGKELLKSRKNSKNYYYGNKEKILEKQRKRYNQKRNIGVKI